MAAIDSARYLLLNNSIGFQLKNGSFTFESNLFPHLNCNVSHLQSPMTQKKFDLKKTHFPRIDAYGRNCNISINRKNSSKKHKAEKKFSTFAMAKTEVNDAVSSIESLENNELELLDPDFYLMGHERSVRAYGVEFREGPKGVGVYASRDLPFLDKPRIIMEVPLELMITISKEHPWVFFPDFVPMGHPIFPIIDSTHPENDWDLRLALLLLLAKSQNQSQNQNFWNLYSDYLPPLDDTSSPLLATKEELTELQDENLMNKILLQQERISSFYHKHWNEETSLKVHAICPTLNEFKLSVIHAQCRYNEMFLTIGALQQDTLLLSPYTDMFNHSNDPNCGLRWRKSDQIMEVIFYGNQQIRAGEEFTVSYGTQLCNESLFQNYGFSIQDNEWETIQFSSDVQIHLESFLSVFSIVGTEDEYFFSNRSKTDKFLDGSVIAAARSLPTWSNHMLPPLPSSERSATAILHNECEKMLSSFPSTISKDAKIMKSFSDAHSSRLKAIISYRFHRKYFIHKILKALEIYSHDILF